MRLTMKKLLGLGLIAAAASTVSAQEGHPIKGSWIGEWEGNPAGESVLLVMNWDGDKITGVINPGTDNIEIDEVELDPSDWSVRIVADTEVDNDTITYEIEGTINELELPTRSITGTWKNDNGSGNFQISRQ